MGNKSLDQVANIALAIVTLATVTVVLSSRNTAAIIRETGRAFSGSVKVAMGR